jgi:hypothetical protein
MSKSKTDLAYLVKEFLFIQRRRVAIQLKILANIKNALSAKKDEELLSKLNKMIGGNFEKIVSEFKPYLHEWNDFDEHLYMRYREIEKELADELKKEMKLRAIWKEWLQYVKGIDLLLAAQLTGELENALKPGETIGTHFKTVSQMWAFAGLGVEDGKAQRRERGERISFNIRLKSILLGKIGPSLIRQHGKYREFYEEMRRKEKEKLISQGIKILPASEIKSKRDKEAISQLHFHRRVLRKTVKLFLAHYWEKQREIERLPTGKAYVFDILGHSDYTPPFYDKEKSD